MFWFNEFVVIFILGVKLWLGCEGSLVLFVLSEWRNVLLKKFFK